MATIRRDRLQYRSCRSTDHYFLSNCSVYRVEGDIMTSRMTIPGKKNRLLRKNLTLVATVALPLIIAIALALLASMGETPRLDASTEATLEASLQQMTVGMSDAQKKEFMADCMELTLPDTMKSAFQLAFLSNGPPASNGPRMFKPLQGMTVAEIHRKAETARRASRDAQKNADDSPPVQPLPGVPSPFGEDPHPEKRTSE
jgi:hypothetical protein